MGYSSHDIDPHVDERGRPIFYVDNSDRFPGYAYCAIYVVAWVAMLPLGGMASWGVSAEALGQGRYYTLFLSMFAHGGLIHLAFNTIAMLNLGPALASVLGSGTRKLARFTFLLLAGGLAGSLTFLAFNPHGHVPMIGASGGLFAFLGALARVPSQSGPIAPLISAETRTAAWASIKSNFWLILIFTLPNILAGTEGGLAWEAHLGGFLFGLLAIPYLFRPRRIEFTFDPAN